MDEHTQVAENAQAAEAPRSETEEPVIDELVVEEISIDGMCGVY